MQTTDFCMGSPASPASEQPPTVWPVHIEVRVAPNATSRFDTIRNAVHSYLTTSLSDIYLPSEIEGWEDVPLLASSIERIAASECPCPTSSLPIEQTALQIHVYQPTDADAFEELTSGSGRGEDDQIMAATACELPSSSWEGLWESLIYSDDIKSKLLDYIYATVVFSDADVDYEVESLTAARAGAMAGTEPSDALRVVNALLTQLDKLKHKKNCLVMSTSNLATAIDSAFVDRADIVQYVDLPPREAIYEILRGCLVELVKKGIVSQVDVPGLAQAQLYERTADFSNLSLTAAQPIIDDTASPSAGTMELDPKERSRLLSICLLQLAQKCRNQEMSGRSLRRLPVLAHARYIRTLPAVSPRPASRPNGASKQPFTSGRGTAVETWLDAMERVVQAQATERTRLQ
ncbi:transporter [Ganoderma sinense ZZ0214-1]|uniref:Transporter n=1 Tax=Ganoderma sinense ZZ0214-1 TaxID=1077348 RepID=A0A2G8SSQ3_9APHY|nr:transporter [Ganoderma sinense ZZ0214-1]